LRARSTVAVETLAAFAMSLMVAPAMFKKLPRNSEI